MFLSLKKEKKYHKWAPADNAPEPATWDSASPAGASPGLSVRGTGTSAQEGPTPEIYANATCEAELGTSALLPSWRSGTPSS